jgi:hypothetical protein
LDQNDLVYYDGRLMPLSQAQAIAREESARHQDSQTSKDPGTSSPRNNPASEWDRQRLGLDARFTSFWDEADVRGQLLRLLRAIQTAKQDAAIARLAAETAKFASWGIIWPIDPAHLPEGVFRFDQAIHQDWCRYDNEKWLKKFAQRLAYPPELIAFRVIAHIGYKKLIKKEEDDNRARKTQAKQVAREKQTPHGDPLPEPNQRRSSPKSKPSRKNR